MNRFYQLQTLPDMSTKIDGYTLSRDWFDFCFENPELIKPNHSALYFFAIEHCNRLGWKKKFGFPTEMAKDAIGIKNYRTYMVTLNDLIDWGFIHMVERSKNQYSANIIALVKITNAPTKALSKAMQKHSRKQGQSTYKSIVSINKPENNINHITNKPENGNLKRFTKPTLVEIENYCLERKNSINPNKFFDYYESNGWKVGRNSMKDWKAAIRNWEASDKKEMNPETLIAI